MSTPVRVRFAPSPTGFLHIGGIRSALFNWLWARHNNGAFLLRIEDTDQSRLVPGAAEQAQESLHLLGLDPDEPVVRQSDRLKLYRTHADELIQKKDLYPCWCSAERLAELRTAAQKAGAAFKYDRHCLDPENHKSLDEPHVLRFFIPDSPETISWDDAVRGHMEVKTSELDDFVALKSDGFPTYHLANVIDDHDMEISHVLRADEWLPSTPKHLLLFSAFGWDAPTYAHMPAILGPDGNKKLSKRDGAKAVGDYITEGYLPDVLLTFLASLGWNDGTTQEMYTRDELISAFSLDRIQKSPAKFDIERLNWMNGVAIRELSGEDLYALTTDFWPAEAKDYDDNYKKRVLVLVHERLKFLAELSELTDFFFADPTVDQTVLTKQLGTEQSHSLLLRISDTLDASDFSEADLEERLRALVEAEGVKAGQLFGLVRVAISGRTAAPGLFETLHVLGKEVSLRRLRATT